MAADGGGDVLIRPVTAEDTRLLRHGVLRPEQPFEATAYDGDDLPQTAHLGIFDLDGHRLVGVASLYRESRPGAGAVDGWRLRGMATAPEAQGRGFGTTLLTACGNRVVAAGGAELWCNARKRAIDFYRRGGFAVVGDEFEVPVIGPHVVMVRHLGD